MDIQQLKLLAGRIRGLLEQSNHPVGHNQSLDLVAALPGLRNWPEVQAFPDRVAACQLDAPSAGRLAFRLKKKFEMELPATELLAALNPPGVKAPTQAPQIWPTGPAPGVYVTTSQDAINALLERYEEATDGELVYAERAGNHWAGSIDLGDDGLWSSGLDRVASGTLLVVGPLQLNQQDWDTSAAHLKKACLQALACGHRVAVLLRTPTPEALHEDVDLIVRFVQSDGEDYDTALLGIVTEEGELAIRDPFARDWPVWPAPRSVATINAIPPAALSALRDSIAKRKTGLLLFGSSVHQEHPAVELVAASLALSEHLGPAARIMPRHRPTPAKDWLVPEAIKQLPFLPSIETAYEQGYRRIIYNPSYTSAELLCDYGQDALLIAGTYGSEVEDVFMSTSRGGGRKEEHEILARVIAILGVKAIATKHGEEVACDLLVRPDDIEIEARTFGEVFEFLARNRFLKWEDELARLLDSGTVTVAGVKKALPRNHHVNEFMSKRSGASRKERVEPTSS